MSIRRQGYRCPKSCVKTKENNGRNCNSLTGFLCSVVVAELSSCTKQPSGCITVFVTESLIRQSGYFANLG